jgi:hypothetical protein
MNKHLRSLLLAAAVITVFIGVTAWLTFYRVAAQPAWILSDERNDYFYGSIGIGKTAGLPYWIWLAMPRMFPEYMPGPGGYAALGMSWEEGREMPVGFAKQRVGYIRVTGNCALCHARSQSNGQDQAPTIIPVVKGNTTDLQPLLNFYRRSAQDPRFNADEFFSEINSDTKLSWLDSLCYRYVFIPRMRKALINDPATVLFTPAILAHIREPYADGRLSEGQMQTRAGWMKQQMQSVKP